MNVWRVNCFRDSEVRGPRKVVIEVANEKGAVLVRGRMFAGPFFKRRLKRRIARFTRLADILQTGGQ